MHLPDELRYSSDHEWARLEGGKARVGITDHAQDQLGDVVFIEVPAIGTEVHAGDKIGEIESTKSVSDLFCPVSGTVVEVNSELDAQPQIVNSDPYGEGWICVVELADPDEVATLLDAAAYRELVEG